MVRSRWASHQKGPLSGTSSRKRNLIANVVSTGVHRALAQLFAPKILVSIGRLARQL
jgi:hypothetical protein